MNDTITLINRLSELDTLRRELIARLEPAGVSETVIDEVFLVLEELLVNTISYGYEDEEEHRIRIGVALEGSLLRLVYRDDAMAYNPLEREDPDLDAPMEDRPIGGLGVHLVKTLCDRVAYAREEGENILTLEKRV